MKVFSNKAKGAVAFALAMSLFCPQVYAVEALSAAEQGVQEPPAQEKTINEILTEDKLPALTLQDALQKAMEHSPELKDLEDSLELLEDNDEKLYDRVGSIKIPNYEYRHWAGNQGIYELISGAFSIENGLEQTKLGQELRKLVLEVTVRTYFTTIISIEDGLELAKANAAIQQTAYEQGQKKHSLGMLSQYNLDQLKFAAQKAADTVATTESSLDQMYISFNHLLGEKSDVRFTFVYDTAFTPFELAQPIEEYIRANEEKDLSIKMKELAVDAAQFKAFYRPYIDTGATADSDKMAYTQAKRAVLTAKKEKETLLRNTYLQIKALETNYASAVADLHKAEAAYRTAQLSFLTGMVTKTAVDGAEMAVVQAQNALNSIMYEHDMLVYKFQNPSILSNGTGAAQ